MPRDKNQRAQIKIECVEKFTKILEKKIHRGWKICALSFCVTLYVFYFFCEPITNIAAHRLIIIDLLINLLLNNLLVRQLFFLLFLWLWLLHFLVWRSRLSTIFIKQSIRVCCSWVLWRSFRFDILVGAG